MNPLNSSSAAYAKGKGRMTAGLSQSQLESVLAFHPSIRYVMLVGKEGTPLESVKRPTVESLEPPEQTKRILERFAIAKGMTSGSDEYFGRMLTIIVRREKLVELLFPSTGYMVLISADPAFPLDKILQLEGLLRSMQAD